MRFVGLDLHKRTLEVCILDPTGKVLARHSVACERKALEAFARDHLEPADQLAVEATTNTWAVADILRPFVAAVSVGNPLQIKAIAQAKVKTDKIDAEVLANLLRCDFLPEVWEPDGATQRLRHLTGVRSALVADRTRLKNRVQSVLAGLLVVLPEGGLFTAKGLAWVRAVGAPRGRRGTVDRFLRLYDAVEAELESLDAQLMTLAHHDARVRLLMTLPGVAHGVALTLIAALGDITRFRDGDHAASYLGLTPIVRQSAGKCYHGLDHQGGQLDDAGDAHAGGPARRRAPRPDRGVLPAAEEAEDPQRGDRGHGPQAGDDRLPDAQEQRAVPVRQARAGAGQAAARRTGRRAGGQAGRSVDSMQGGAERIG